MSEDFTSGLGSDRLAQLLRLGENEQELRDQDQAETLDPNEQKQHQLTSLLNAAIPVDDALMQALPIIIQRVCRELGVLSTGTMEKALLDPVSDLVLIEQIKGYAKKATKTAVSSIEKEAATVLYYAAIASALVFHNKRITKTGLPKLKQSFEKLGVTNWVNSDIAGLLMDAAKISAKLIKSHS